jgi:hypothetical protein
MRSVVELAPSRRHGRRLQGQLRNFPSLDKRTRHGFNQIRPRRRSDKVPVCSAGEVIVASSSPFPRTVGLGAFSADEARAIRQLVDGLPDVDHRILQIVQPDPDELEVWTGEVLSPLCGSGQVIYVRKQGSRWVLDQDSVGMWVA